MDQGYPPATQPPASVGSVGGTQVTTLRPSSGTLGGTTLQHATVPFPSYNSPEGMVSFTVTGDTVSLVPGLKLTVSQTATGPIEQFQADK